MKKLCLVIILLAAMLPAAPQVQEDGAVKGVWTMDYEAAVKASLLNRDKIDSSRKTAPLKVADGAIVIDSTDLTIDEVLAAILENLPAEYRG